jgi:hypothetical protein
MHKSNEAGKAGLSCGGGSPRPRSKKGLHFMR